LVVTLEVPVGETSVFPRFRGEARNLADEKAGDPDRNVLVAPVMISVELNSERAHSMHSDRRPAEEAPDEGDENDDDEPGDDRPSFFHPDQIVRQSRRKVRERFPAGRLIRGAFRAGSGTVIIFL
jgi:hypothetical protein